MAGERDCITCDLFRELTTVGDRFAKAGYDALIGPTTDLFMFLTTAWLLWVLIYQGMIQGDLGWRRHGAPTLFIIFTYMLLSQGGDLYFEWIYEPVRGVMAALPNALMKATGAKNLLQGGEGTEAALGTVETEILRIVNFCRTLMVEASFYEIWKLAGAAFLIIPYLFAWCVFFMFTLEGFFKLMAVSAIAPIGVAFFAFRKTRGFVNNGLKVMLSGVLTVTFAGVAMGFTIAAIRTFTEDFGAIGADEGTIRMEAYVFSPRYWGAFLVGWVSVFFHFKAATLAANISEAADSAASAAIVSGGMLAAGTIASAPGAAAVGRFGQGIGNSIRGGSDRFLGRNQ